MSTTLSVIISNACEVAWHDENKRFSPQDFRDVLQGALEKVETNPNLISPLISHKVKGVDKHYSNHDIDEFLQVFAKALPLLIPKTVEEVQTKLDEDERKISSIVTKNETLIKKVDDLSQLIGMSDLINSEKDWNEVQAFFKELRWKKELRERAEAKQMEKELYSKVSNELGERAETK
jgi:hypothetical protein